MCDSRTRDQVSQCGDPSWATVYLTQNKMNMKFQVEDDRRGRPTPTRDRWEDRLRFVYFRLLCFRICEPRTGTCTFVHVRSSIGNRILYVQVFAIIIL